MGNGYIKLNRGIQASPIWTEDKPFAKGQAWTDLLLSAAHKDTFFFVRGNKVSVARGQTAMSQLTMAKRWGWSRGKVKRFLNDLESEQMLVQQTGQLTTLVTICNYEKYQGGSTTDGTTDSTADGQQTGHIQEVTNGRKSFQKPNVEEIKNYMVERGRGEAFANAQAIKFFNYYESVGWVVGKSKKPMKSWKSAVSGWLERCKPEQPAAPSVSDLRREGKLG